MNYSALPLLLTIHYVAFLASLVSTLRSLHLIRKGNYSMILLQLTPTSLSANNHCLVFSYILSRPRKSQLPALTTFLVLFSIYILMLTVMIFSTAGTYRPNVTVRSYWNLYSNHGSKFFRDLNIKLAFAR